MTDITYCVSPDCENRCERHLSENIDKIPIGDYVTVSDLSGVCREYISELVEEVKNDGGN